MKTKQLEWNKAVDETRPYDYISTVGGQLIAIIDIVEKGFKICTFFDGHVDFISKKYKTLDKAKVRAQKEFDEYVNSISAKLDRFIN